MQITASIKDDGLGLVIWWSGGEEGDEGAAAEGAADGEMEAE